MDIAVNVVLECWLVLGQMAPYLLFGFLVAGLLSVWMVPAWIERHLGGSGPGPVLKASLFGVPLPLCSCGVIPVSASIRRHGASRAATTSFLLSTPQTGVDSIAVTYALLGGVFAVFRPVVALATGVLGGYLVQLLGERERPAENRAAGRSNCSEPCCDETAAGNPLLRAVRYGFVTLPQDIGVPLLVGVLIAGAMAALLPPDQLRPYLGGGILSILLMMAAGVPVYVCATASVPIAAGLVHLGASPGAALAFLISGPATNAATFTTIWKLLGWRTAAIYLVTIALSAVACGLSLDWLFAATGATLPRLADHVHAMSQVGWASNLWAMALLAVLAVSAWSTARARRRPAGEDQKADAGGAEQRVVLAVGGMTCDHCVQSVRRALLGCPGVASAEVDLKNGRAKVAGRGLDPQKLAAAVTAVGYQAGLPDDPKAPG